MAKIAESRLPDIHPMFGGTRGTHTEHASFPPLATALFVLSHVQKIETEDFDNEVRPGAVREENAKGIPRQFARDSAICAKYDELALQGKRNYVKEIMRSVPGAAGLSARRIRAIAKNH